MKTSDKKNKTWSHLSWFNRLLVNNRWLRVLCCYDDEHLDDIVLEAKFRDEFRSEMKSHIRGCDINAINEVVDDIFEETGYDMSKCQSRDQDALLASAVGVEVELRASRRDSNGRLSGSDAILMIGDGSTSQIPDSLSEQPVASCSESVEGGVVVYPAPARKAVGDHNRVRIVPRFVASMVFAMRAKFGRLASTEANRLLIIREYLRVCRDACVRHSDIAHHEQFVINTYFNESLTEEVATVRVRLPRWLRAAFGRTPIAAPTVC